ncbi:MAG TPA: hypothetical protein PL037_06020, partial [Elusimicrobiales bacterium]|nr:hypothetical protein [Elusimicrobiales bacterium]
MGFNLPTDVSGAGVTSAAAWTTQADSVYSSLFTEGYKYQVISRARDLAGNYQTVYSTVSFGVDATAPVAANDGGGHFTGVPAHQWFYNDISTFTGTVSDYSPFASPRNYEAGLGTAAASHSIQVAFRRLSDNKWWDGADFTVTQDEPDFRYGVMPAYYNDGTSMMGVSSGTWEFYMDPAKLSDNTTYYAVVRALDLAGNLQTSYATNYFTVDRSTPSSDVSVPAVSSQCADSYKFTSLSQLSGTAQDTGLGEVRVVSLRIIREKTNVTQDACSDGVADDKCWDGFNWVGPAGSCDIWLDSGTVNGANWSYNLPMGFLSPKSVYRLTARAKDKAGNIADISLPARGLYDRRFRFAENVPVTYITVPSINQRIRPDALTTIQGTSGNSLTVSVRVTRNSDGKDWQQFATSGTYVAAPFWNAPVSTSGASGNWLFNISTTAWDLSNGSYTIRSAGTSPGNQCEGDETCAAPLTRGNGGLNVYIDTQPPTGMVTVPAAGSYSSLTYIRGTAQDSNNLGGMSVSGLRLWILNAGTGDCYNGGTWGACGASSDIGLVVPSGGNADGSCGGASCGVVDWSTSSASGWGLLSGYQYELRLRPADTAGNLSVYPDIPALSVVYDTNPPVAVATRPVAGYVYRNLLQLSGTAADPAPDAAPRNNMAGLDHNEIQIVALDQANKQWDGANFDFYADKWVTLAQNSPWNYDAALLNSKLATGRYLLLARSSDTAGNVQNSFSQGVSSITFYVDRSSPTAYIGVPAHNSSYRS